MSGINDAVAPIALEHLVVRYGRRLAVDDVTLAVPAGRVYALLGRNGAGKSSIVRCLLGQRRPSSGRALLLGRDAWSTRARLMDRIGVVPEDPDAPPEMTAPDLTAFCSRLYARWDAVGVEQRLARFAIPRDVPFGRLSKGQKAEVMLTLALGSRPELLVLDDPTLGLDVVARKELYEELVVELADHGTTVFLTTHDLAGVEAIADRVGILVGGRLALDEDMETLKARFRRVRLARAEGEAELVPLGTVRVSSGSLGAEAVVSRFDDASFARLRERPALRDADAAGMSLEEIFVTVTGEGRGGER